jgi:hypothetical protein
MSSPVCEKAVLRELSDKNQSLKEVCGNEHPCHFASSVSAFELTLIWTQLYRYK